MSRHAVLLQPDELVCSQKSPLPFHQLHACHLTLSSPKEDPVNVVPCQFSTMADFAHLNRRSTASVFPNFAAWKSKLMA